MDRLRQVALLPLPPFAYDDQLRRASQLIRQHSRDLRGRGLTWHDRDQRQVCALPGAQPAIDLESREPIMSLSHEYRLPLDPARYQELVAALGDSPETVISLHHL